LFFCQFLYITPHTSMEKISYCFRDDCFLQSILACFSSPFCPLLQTRRFPLNASIDHPPNLPLCSSTALSARLIPTNPLYSPPRAFRRPLLEAPAVERGSPRLYETASKKREVLAFKRMASFSIALSFFFFRCLPLSFHPFYPMQNSLIVFSFWTREKAPR